MEAKDSKNMSFELFEEIRGGSITDKSLINRLRSIKKIFMRDFLES